jgi:hypothetical protein
LGAAAALAGYCCLQSLIQLGLKTVFDPDKADFSRLSDQPLFISDVLHSVSDGFHRLFLNEVHGKSHANEAFAV